MTTRNLLDVISSSILSLSCTVAMICLTACEDTINNATNYNTYERDALTDPNIIPEVIFTLPASNTIGPFESIYNKGQTYSPHFVIQFNKLVSRYLITSAVSIEGVDVPVQVFLNSSFYDNPDYSDIYGFEVTNEYGNGIVPYSIGKTYTVVIDTSLVDINGNHLSTPYTFSFEPEPNFRVTSVFPRNGTLDLKPLTTYIAFVFNSSPSADITSYLHIEPQKGVGI